MLSFNLLQGEGTSKRFTKDDKETILTQYQVLQCIALTAVERHMCNRMFTADKNILFHS